MDQVSIDKTMSHMSPVHSGRSRFRTPPIVLCKLIAFICVIGLSSSRSAAQAPTENEPIYLIRTVDGQRGIGKILTLTAESLHVDVIAWNSRRVDTPENRHWNLDDVLACERVTLLKSVDPSGTPANQNQTDQKQSFDVEAINRRSRAGSATLCMSNGDRLAIELLEFNEQQLVVRVLSLSDMPTWAIPLELVRGFIGPDVDEARFSFSDSPVAGDSAPALNDTSDLLALQNGDRLTGELLSFSDGQFEFDATTGKVSLLLSDVDAFEMNSELMIKPTPTQPRTYLTFSDGSYLTLKSLKTAGEDDRGGGKNSTLHWIGVSQFDQEFRISPSDLAAIEFWDRRAIPLSEQEIADYQFTPFLSRVRPVMADRNVNGRLLRVAGQQFSKGLGLHSQCRLTYRLDERFQGFQAGIGIDDDASDQGQAFVSVLIDGELRIDKLAVRRGDELRRVELTQLESASELTIVVEFGPFGDVGDYVDLVEPFLILKQPRQASTPAE